MTSLSRSALAGRHPTLAQLITALLGFTIIAALIAIDRWLFAAGLDGDYLEWYRANADRLSFVLTVAAFVWGDAIEGHTGLISANPLDQIGAHLQLIGVPLHSLGTSLRSTDAISRPSRLDVLLAVPVVMAFSGAVLAWVLFVLPLQYFVNLVAGAPARLALGAGMRTVAHWRADGRLEVKEIGRAGKTPEGWWGSPIAEKPIRLTGFFATLLTFALKLLDVL
jgi:hypothetical protein